MAGTSVRNALKPYDSSYDNSKGVIIKLKYKLGLLPKYFSNDYSGHITAKELKNDISEKVFNTYFKFGFVRNPWDWQVSLYTYMLKNKKHHQHELVSSFHNFDEYIDWRVHNDLHLQKDFFYDEQNNSLMDFIGKIENLDDDFNLINKKLGIKVVLPHLNRSREHNAYLHFYSDKSINLVGDAFKEDIEAFGYKIPVLKK